MAVRQRDPVITQYRTIVAYGVAGVLILLAGLVEYVHFEPFSNSTGVHADIKGVFMYNPATRQTAGSDRTAFQRTEDFAAVVDWSYLPPNVTVQAVWYDGFGNIVGQAGPGTPSELKDESTVPAELPQGLPYHLPGEYIFAVERLQGGQPVEVLARRLIEVLRT